VQPGFNPDVGEIDMFYRSGIPDRDIDAAIGIKNGDVAEIVIGHGILVPATDPDRAGT